METDKKISGALIGLIVIIIILITGGIYVWQSSKVVPPEINTQAQTDALNEQDSAALDALEQDITTTDTNIGVDASTVK